MIALDTNVLVRFLVADDRAQAARSRALFESQQVLLSTSVLLETEWVLRAAYRLPREDVVRLFRAVLGLANVSAEDHGLVAQAIDWHARGLDFADALHLASTTEADRFATFDARLIRAAARLSAGRVVTA